MDLTKRFFKFTVDHTNNPVYIRSDLITGWTVEHNKTLLIITGYDIDLTVKETPEQILQMFKGEACVTTQCTRPRYKKQYKEISNGIQN